MAENQSRPPRRPVVGSRNPTARPRRVAGQRGEQPAGPEEPNAPAQPIDEPIDEQVDEQVGVAVAPDPAAPADLADPRRPGGIVGSRRTTVALLVALLLLVAAAAGESWYLWLRDGPTVSASRPVVTGPLAHQAAVEAASSATEEILSTSYQDYDAQVDQATSKMTDSFAREYRQTVGDIRADFIKAHTRLTVKVVGAGVVQASSSQVQALLFLNQYVEKKGEKTDYTPYRALVTVMHTEHGWLVSDLETK